MPNIITDYKYHCYILTKHWQNKYHAGHKDKTIKSLKCSNGGYNYEAVMEPVTKELLMQLLNKDTLNRHYD